MGRRASTKTNGSRFSGNRSSASTPSGACAGCPRYSTPSRGPWIHVDAAGADRIAETVGACPTGALHFHRLDGGRQEEAADETLVEPRPDGPLFLRGRIRIEDAEGNLLREDTRVALRCRLM